jgi:hypothetical protein
VSNLSGLAAFKPKIKSSKPTALKISAQSLIMTDDGFSSVAVLNSASSSVTKMAAISNCKFPQDMDRSA